MGINSNNFTDADEVIIESAKRLSKQKLKIKTGSQNPELVPRFGIPQDFQGGAINVDAFDVSTNETTPLGAQMRRFMGEFHRSMNSNSTVAEAEKSADKAWRTNQKNSAYRIVLGPHKKIIITDALYEGQIPNKDSILLLMKILLCGNEEVRVILYEKAAAANLNPFSWFIQHIHVAISSYAREYTKKMQIIHKESEHSDSSSQEYSNCLSNCVDDTVFMLLENMAEAKECSLGEVICNLIPLL